MNKVPSFLYERFIAASAQAVIPANEKDAALPVQRRIFAQQKIKNAGYFSHRIFLR
mgnify:CR=1 FL=1